MGASCNVLAWNVDCVRKDGWVWLGRLAVSMENCRLGEGEGEPVLKQEQTIGN
jgi:hypothetical protein